MNSGRQNVALRAIAASEDGMSLMELVLASALGLILLAVGASILISTQGATGIVDRKGYSLDDGRAAVSRIGRDARDARTISPYTDPACAGATANSCAVLNTLDTSGNEVTVRYRYMLDSGVGTLARAVVPHSGSPNDVPLLQGLQNTDILEVSGRTIHVRFVLSQRPNSPETVTLENYLTARNS